MSKRQLAEINAMIGGKMPEIEIDLPAWREISATSFAEFFPPPPDARFEQADGLRAEWTRTPRCIDGVTIVMFHGGGYCLGTVPGYRDLAARIADAAASPVLNVDYRLAPEHAYPAAVDDAVAALAWLDEQGVDPESVVLLGDSAGGGLALAAMFRRRDIGKKLPAAAVLFSPWTDLLLQSPSIIENAETDVLHDPHITPKTIAAYAPGMDLRNPEISPVYGNLTGLPPLQVHVSEVECFRDDSIRLHEAALRDGVRSELIVVPDLPHVWPLWASRLDEGQETIAQSAAFALSHAHPHARS